MKKLLFYLLLISPLTYAQWNNVQVLGSVTNGNLVVWEDGNRIQDAGILATDFTTFTGQLNTNTADIQSLEANAIASNLWTTVRDAATNAVPDDAAYLTVSNNAVAAYAAVQSYAVDPATLQTQITANATAIIPISNMTNWHDDSGPRQVITLSGTVSPSDVAPQIGEQYARLYLSTTNTVNAFAGAYWTNGAPSGALRLDYGVYTGGVLSVSSDEHVYSDYENPQDKVTWYGNVVFAVDATNCGIYGLHVVGNIDAYASSAVKSYDPNYMQTAPIVKNCYVAGNVSSNATWSSVRVVDSVITNGLSDQSATALANGFVGSVVNSTVGGLLRQAAIGSAHTYIWDSTISHIEGTKAARSGSAIRVHDSTITSDSFWVDSGTQGDAYFYSCAFDGTNSWNYTNLDQTSIQFIDCTGLPADINAQTTNLKLTNCLDSTGAPIADQ